MRSARWLALGYLAGSTAARLAAHRVPRRRTEWRVASIRITPVRVGLCRFGLAPSRGWEYRAYLSWEANDPGRTKRIKQIMDRVFAEHGETLRRLGEE